MCSSSIVALLRPRACPSKVACRYHVLPKRKLDSKETRKTEVGGWKVFLLYNPLLDNFSFDSHANPQPHVNVDIYVKEEYLCEWMLMGM